MRLHVPITRLRAPVVAVGYGNSAPNWPAAAQQEFLVHWSARDVSEVVGDEPRTVTKVKVMGNPDLDLLATDRVVGPDGQTYEVDGEIMLSFRRGALHHIRAFLKRVNLPTS